MTDKDSTGQPKFHLSLLRSILYITAKIIFSRAKVAVIELPYENKNNNNKKPLMPSYFPIMSHTKLLTLAFKIPHGMLKPPFWSEFQLLFHMLWPTWMTWYPHSLKVSYSIV